MSLSKGQPLRAASPSRSPTTALQLWWHHTRNRILINPRFQQWAARLPLFKGIAQREALALHHITAGFVYSQVLQACIRLDLFTRLHTQPSTVEQLSAVCDLSQEAMLRLLRAGASLRLLERIGSDYWGVGPLGAATLAYPGIPAMVHHHALLYRDLSDPIALLRHQQPSELSRYWPYENSAIDADTSHAYSHLMAQSMTLISGHILDAINLSSAQHILDLGGGTGAFARAVQVRYPDVKVTVADLPHVAALARAEHGNTEPKLTFWGGDMLEEALPTGADTLTLIRILHDHNTDRVQQILRKARAYLAEGGELIIAEPLAETPGAEPIGDAYFGFYLWAMGSGAPRSKGELTTLLLQAGFTEVTEHKSNVPALVRILRATTKDAKNI